MTESLLNIAETNKTLQKWLNKNYYHVGRERNYKNIPPRIMVDSYIEHEDALQEYKIFCFQGKPRLIDVNIFTENERRTGIFTPTWEYIPVKLGYESCAVLPEKPEKLEELLSVAGKLSEAFSFVRVDLYLNKNQIIFSELTLTSGGGLVHFQPHEYDITFGKYFEETP